MECTKCKKGKVNVHVRYECETIYKQDKDGVWKASKPTVLGYTNLYGECNKCGETYTVNEHLFYNEGKIQLNEQGSEKVEIQTSGNQNPSIKVMVDDKKIFALLETLGWVVEPIFEKMPQIPGMFEKVYCCPKGKGLFGGLVKEKADKLLADTEKAFSDNGIPYYSRELTLADML